MAKSRLEGMKTYAALLLSEIGTPIVVGHGKIKILMDIIKSCGKYGTYCMLMSDLTAIKRY